MRPKLYKFDFSPPARACMMACDIFGVDAEMVDVNLIAKEHRTPKFLKLNPLHTVPVFEDGDLVIHDSHAILMYLADVYSKDDSWYPKDVKQRALVNQKLLFDTSNLFPNIWNVIYSLAKYGEKKVSDSQRNSIEESYGFLEEFLSRSRYLAGDTITIADLSAIASVTTIDYIITLDGEKYPHTLSWIKEMEQKSFFKKYETGLRQCGGWLKTLINVEI